ncbi:MAG: transporter substrate-binding domain-containing protein [Pyramidobacter sp.]|jgi:putative amino-acid transport system substrate-binding protein
MKQNFALVMCVILFSVFCVSSHAFAHEDRVIRIATPGNYSPFTMYDELTQVWSGFEIDLWRLIGKKVNQQIEFIHIDTPAAFAEVDLGRADTVAKQISITPARQQKYEFTQPFFFSPYCLTVREDNNEIKSWKDMEGKKLALREGSAMNEFVAALDPDNKVEKVVYESAGSALQETSMGRVDAYPFAYLILPYRLKKNPELKLKSIDVENPLYTEINAYPFARTERGERLRKLTNDVLSEMIADGSYSALCKKWFSLDVMQTNAAKNYLKKHGR